MSHALHLPPVVIDTARKLSEAVERLDDHPVIAVDTESNSLFAYRERVCLVQISTPDTDYIVDTLAVSDLSPLAPLFADVGKEKVFHGADYDIGTLRRDYGFAFQQIFDTMIASRILGIKQFGLASLLRERFGIELDKRMQRHDWGKRPLRAEELAYARLDSHYLLPLRDQLLAELRQRGREREAREMFERVAEVVWQRKPFAPGDFWRTKGVLTLGNEGRGALRALAMWRDDTACRLDRPPFKVLSDQTLVHLAGELPTTLHQLRGIPGLSSRQVDSLGDALLGAIRDGRKHPQPLSGRPPRCAAPDEEVLACYERLREWRKERAAERGVEPDILISNSQLMDIARVAPADLDELRAVAIGDYQIEAYGDELLDAVHKACQGV